MYVVDICFDLREMYLKSNFSADCAKSNERKYDGFVKTFIKSMSLVGTLLVAGDIAIVRELKVSEGISNGEMHSGLSHC